MSDSPLTEEEAAALLSGLRRCTPCAARQSQIIPASMAGQSPAVIAQMPHDASPTGHHAIHTLKPAG